MLVEFRAKSQITLPKEIVDRLGISEGDRLKLFEKDGIIYIMPIAVYPKNYLDKLKDAIDTTKAKIASGEQPTLDVLDELLAKLQKH